MRRLGLLLICVIVLFSLSFIAFAEELPRGKSMGVTKVDFVHSFKSMPGNSVIDVTDISFVDLGVQDYRRIYYAQPFDGAFFSLHCEDTTDEIFAVFVQIEKSAFLGDPSSIYKVSRYIKECTERILRAVVPDVSTNDLDVCTGLVDILDQSNTSRAVPVGGVEYTFVRNEFSVSFGVNSVDVFASEAEFLEYRASTIDAPVVSSPAAAELSQFSISETDFSGMSLKDLLDLQQRIILAMWESDEWQEVEVPTGLYRIGKDIPAGHWTIKPNGGYATVTYGDKVDKSLIGISYDSDTYEYKSLRAPEASLNSVYSAYLGDEYAALFDSAYDSNWSVNLVEGYFIHIEDGPVLFTPYAGVELGFRF